MTMRAYTVRDDSGDGACVLVAAESPGQAKQLARCTGLFDFSDWLDMGCSREPRADKYIDDDCVPSVADGDSVAEHRIMRDCGWYELNGELDECSRCGLYEWAGMPESIIGTIDDEAVCAGCAARGAVNDG